MTSSFSGNKNKSKTFVCNLNEQGIKFMGKLTMGRVWTFASCTLISDRSHTYHSIYPRRSLLLITKVHMLLCNKGQNMHNVYICFACKALANFTFF
jgi:hypothetical protein